jgi:pullulanase/glycogen debranching enzyme
MRVLEIDVKTFAQGGKVKHPGTFLGVAERVDQIRAVGANTVILSPCHATAKGAGSHSHHAALSFMAPDPALSTDPTNPAAAHAELREMVHALHAAGVEVIPSLDLTFTADGVDAHPTGVSLRGLDNASYFRPNGVVNCGHPAFQALVHRATRYWALQFGVDGFYFLNAENMAQDAEGLVMDAPSLPEALCQDPILSGLKLVAAPSHGTTLLPRGGARGFPHWGIWQQRNSLFTRDLTALLAEVNHTALDGVAARLTGSADIFGAGWSSDEFSPLPGNLAAERRPSFSFNAAAMQHGPSVKNLAVEAAGAAGAAVMASGGGPLPTATTIAKSMLLSALLAQGVPVINHEDVADVEMARFVGVVSRLRRKLAHLLLPPKFDSPRDITWHGANAANEPEWVGAIGAVSGGEEGGEFVPYHAPHGSSYLGFSVRHPDGSAVYVGFNPHPMTVSATLPAAPAGHTWLRAVDTSLEAPQDAAMENFEEIEGGGTYLVSGKASIVLVAAVIEHLK